MSSWRSSWIALSLCLLAVVATVNAGQAQQAPTITSAHYRLELPKNVTASRITCLPLFAKSDIPGAELDTQIDVTREAERTTMNVVIYDLSVYDHDTLAYCWTELHNAGQCGVSPMGYVVLNKKVNANSYPGDIAFWTLNKTRLIETFTVQRKGYYCIAVSQADPRDTQDLVGSIFFQHPYGQLPPIEYPHLPFYGILGLCYLAVSIVWVGLTIYYWRDALQVQHFISGVLFLCMLEQTFRYAYFANWNQYGVPSFPLLTISIIVGAGRLAAALSALLVVCLGLGMAKPTLGTDGQKVLILGFFHFIFYAFYDSASNSSVSGENPSLWSLLTVFPLTVTFVIFYFWTFTALASTMSKLLMRRQTEKLAAYLYLKRILVVSICFLIIIIVGAFLQNADAEARMQTWDTLWFTTDGAFALLFFVIFVMLMYLWRPTANNHRYTLHAVPTSDPEGEEVVLGAEGTAGGIRNRTQPAPRAAEDDDDLKWVEEHIPVLEEVDDMILGGQGEMEEQIQMLKSERSKMN